MRTLLASSVLVSMLTAPLACGGARASGEGAGTPPSTASVQPDGGSAGASEAAGSAPAVDAGPATTTTMTLGNGGDLQGAKLTESHTVASTTGSATPARPKGPHGHDPGRSPADIRAIIIAHRDEARACYDKALAVHPGIEGDLVIQWTIDPKGSVTQVSEDASRSQITEPSVVACIAAVIQKIQFAPSPGGYETKAFYPFNFHPHHGG
jgi:hypothetical protein